jgi:hypothetical protein
MAHKTARFGMPSGRGKHPKGSRIALQEVYAVQQNLPCPRNIKIERPPLTKHPNSRSTADIADAVSLIQRTANGITPGRVDR